MAVITIKKQRLEDDLVFEIDDFRVCGCAFGNGIEAPTARYRITIPLAIEKDMLGSNIDVERQVALFSSLGPLQASSTKSWTKRDNATQTTETGPHHTRATKNHPL